MPYQKIEDLPTSVRHVLPTHAQEIYLAAFNSAWDKFSDESKDAREAICHRIAWSAVKRNYEKQGEHWVLK